MKRIILAVFAVLLLSAPIEAKRMSDLKIYINPGHGGYDSDDRPILIHPFTDSKDTLGYWESKSNLYKGLHMYHILDSLGAKPYISRIKNTTADDRGLYDISDEANKLGVDLFFSIHSNAGENVNYPIMLYREDEVEEEGEYTPRYPGNVTLSQMLWKNLHSNKLAVWTRDKEYVEGDLTFYKNMWQGGLGVLRYLYTVGLLSEGGMHEHRPEAHRLMNDDYLWLEAWHFVRTIMEYENTDDRFVTGNVAGVVYDDHNKREFIMPWINHAFGRDVNAPLNGATVELRDANGTVVQRRTTDNMYNGVFVFRNVAPGKYTVYSVKDGYYALEQEVTVTANEVTYQDMPLNLQRPGHLAITEYSPTMAPGQEGVICSEPLVFNFNYDVDCESLEKNVSIEPACAGRWVYSKSYHTAKYVPDISWARVTGYTITVPASVKSADTHNPDANLENELKFYFKTLDRSCIEIIGQYPKPNGMVHYSKPTIEFRFDNKIDAASLRQNLSITDESGRALTLNSRLTKYNQLVNGFGNAQVVLSEDLTPGQKYTVTLSGELRDNDRIPLINDLNFTFTACDVTADASTDAVVFDDFEDTFNFVANTENSVGMASKPMAAYTTSSVINGLRSANLSYSFGAFHDGVAEWDYVGAPVHFNSVDMLSMYIYGDLNNHELYAIMQSGASRKYIKIDDINFRGWQRYDIKLDELDADWCPYVFAGLRLVQTESASTQKGSILFDTMARVDGDLNSITDIQAQGINVTTQNGVLTVTGPNTKVPVAVYSTDSRLVTEFHVGDSAAIGTGIFLVTINGTTVKVVSK